MKTSGGFKVVPSGEGHTLMVAGGRYTFKASGEGAWGEGRDLRSLPSPKKTFRETSTMRRQ